MSDKNFSNVVLLCGFNGADGATTFTDESTAARTATFVGNAQLDTANAKWGSASALFDGNGDAITFANHADFNFSNGDVTWEAWVYATSYPHDYSACMGKWNAASSQRGWDLGYRAASNRWEFFYSITGAASAQLNGNTPMATGAWHHIAVCRNGANLRMFLDGVQDGSTVNISTNNIAQSNETLKIGRGSSTSGVNEFWNGWIDDVRISKFARYTTTFRPPRGPHDRRKNLGVLGGYRQPIVAAQFIP